MVIKRKNLNMSDVSTLLYNAVVALMLLVFFYRLPNWRFQILVNVGILAFILFVVSNISEKSVAVVKFLRYFYPMIVFLIIYEQTGRINRIFFQETLDPLFVKIEALIFGFQPAVCFAEVFNSTFMVEFMHFSYFTYYFIIPSMGIILYCKKDKFPFGDFMFSLCNTFYVCNLIYIFLPVVGARTFEMNFFPNGRLFTAIMNVIYDNFEIYGGAAPSSHVAVAAVIMYYSWRYTRCSAWIYFPVGICLMLSTVYCRYHYAVDVLAGIFMAVLAVVVSRRVFLFLQKKNLD